MRQTKRPKVKVSMADIWNSEDFKVVYTPPKETTTKKKASTKKKSK